MITKTAADTSHQNGLAERAQRQLEALTRVMLRSNNAPANFWPLAVEDAARVDNLSPRRRHGQAKTPFELFFGKAPDLTHSFAFYTRVTYGVLPFAQSAGDQTGKHLRDRGAQGYAVGYDMTQPGTYLVYDDKTQKLIRTRDVRFFPDASSMATTYVDPDIFSIAVPSPEVLAVASAAVYPIPVLQALLAPAAAPPVVPAIAAQPVILAPPPPAPLPAPVPVPMPALLQAPVPMPILLPILAAAPVAVPPTAPPILPTPANPAAVAGGEEEDKRPQQPNVLPQPRRTSRLRKPKVFANVALTLPVAIQADQVMSNDLASTKSDSAGQVAYALIAKRGDRTGPLWDEARKKELDMMTERDVYTVLPRAPQGAKVIHLHWVYSIKSSGVYKARLVANGSRMEAGIDYEAAYSPTLRLSSARLLLAIAVASNSLLWSFDVSSAYLYADLKETIYARGPSDTQFEDKVWLLKRSVYGLPQSSSNWHKMIDGALHDIGFAQSQFDPAIYYKEGCICGIYVDDACVVSKTEADKAELIAAVQRRFSITRQEQLNSFLGLDFAANDTGLLVHQHRHVQDLLQRFGADKATSANIPMAPNLKLPKDFVLGETERAELQHRIRSAVGSLIYISCGTRPDISYTVHRLSKYLEHPSHELWAAVFQVLRYLKATPHGLTFCHPVDGAPRHLAIAAYSDATWASEVDDERRSQMGYILTINGNLISWCTRTHKATLRSSAESELMALAQCCNEILYLKNLLDNIGFLQPGPIPVYVDNMTVCTQVNKDQLQYSQLKHVEIAGWLSRQLVREKIITVSFVPSAEQSADILTKALSAPSLKVNRERLLQPYRPSP